MEADATVGLVAAGRRRLLSVLIWGHAVRDMKASPGLPSVWAAGFVSERLLAKCSGAAAVPGLFGLWAKEGDGGLVGGGRQRLGGGWMKYSRISGQTGSRFRAASSHRLQAGRLTSSKNEKKKKKSCEVNISRFKKKKKKQKHYSSLMVEANVYTYIRPY